VTGERAVCAIQLGIGTAGLCESPSARVGGCASVRVCGQGCGAGMVQDDTTRGVQDAPCALPAVVLAAAGRNEMKRWGADCPIRLAMGSDVQCRPLGPSPTAEPAMAWAWARAWACA
jgi:hypothetical protein